MLKSKINLIVVVILLLLGVNYLAKYLFFRFDLTENHEFTLSKASKDILKNLDEPVEVTAYFSNDLPVDINKTRDELENLLIEFSNISKGKLTYKFEAPNEDPKLEEEAAKVGIRPVMINVREKDQSKQQKAFLGAVIKAGDKMEPIPIIQPGTAMEYAFTTSIKKLVGKNKPRIGFIQGHGEPAIQELAQAYQELSILYSISSAYISSDTVDLSAYKTLIMVRPTDSIPPADLQRLENYISKGGNLVLAFNEVDANIQAGTANAMNTGLKSWLQNIGVEVEDALVIDSRCGQVNVQQQQGFFSFSTPVQFPYLPLIQKFPSHPITKGLEQVMLEFASPLSYKGKEEVQFTPILYTSEKSSREAVPLRFEIQKSWTSNDFPEQNICVGAVLEGNILGSTSSKMVVITDGDFAVNGRDQRRQNPDNISVFVNSIDYLVMIQD
ncbi:MAG: GldG family protein [Saprospiraceae bacterium]|nr:GldG family protein [Saprospiraceae bacterium]